ncbi:hypothetical protein D3C81_2280110 [compost metagenome]
MAFPPAAQIGQQVEVIGRVGEARFMNNQSGIELTIADGGHDFIERQDNDLGRTARYLLRSP